MNELYLSSSASVVPYAIVRRKSDGRVAAITAAAFVTFADADLATYVTPLTSRGGDLWSANFPTWIEPGEYLIAYYDRAGSAATTSDVKLKEADLYWTGAAVAAGGAVPTAAEMVALLKQALRDNPIGLVQVAIDGQITQYERSQALAELKYWTTLAARESGRRPLFSRLDLSRV